MFSEFRYVRHEDLVAAIQDGWIPTNALTDTHHGVYAVLAEKDQKGEEWRPVVGFEGFYEVSSYGRVQSLDRYVRTVPPGAGETARLIRGKILKPRLAGIGYEAVGLSSDVVKRKSRYVSHLVAEAFIGPRPVDMQVCHSDGYKRNNRADNLRYDTILGNEADKVKHGTLMFGERTPSAKLTEAQVRKIRLRCTTESYIAIATDMNVSVGTVSSVARGLVWKHLVLLPGEVGTPEGNQARKVAWSQRASAWATSLNKTRAGRSGK